jgi:HlyD family secretion protein
MLRRLLSVLVVITAVAALVLLFIRSRDDSRQVEVQPAPKRALFQSYVTASGELVAARYADIGSSVMGRITSLPVAEGDRVRRGQILARIDPVQARAELEAVGQLVLALESEEEAAAENVRAAGPRLAAAEAALRENRRTLERAQQLFARGALPQSDLDTARLSVESGEAQVAAAQAELDRAERSAAAAARRTAQARAQMLGARDLYQKTEIQSPMNGVVSRLRVREGEMVVVGIQNQPGTTLMTVSDLLDMNAEVRVAEAEILRIRLGQPAMVMLDAAPERRFAGKVAEIGTSALPIAGTGAAAREFRVVVSLDEPNPDLRPGLTCDADILTDELTDVVTVPLQAVVIRELDGEEQTGVFLLVGDTARFTPVRAGVIGGLEIVVEGISEGDPVITGPFQALRELTDGDRVGAASG